MNNISYSTDILFHIRSAARHTPILTVIMLSVFGHQEAHWDAMPSFGLNTEIYINPKYHYQQTLHAPYIKTCMLSCLSHLDDSMMWRRMGSLCIAQTTTFHYNISCSFGLACHHCCIVTVTALLLQGALERG